MTSRRVDRDGDSWSHPEMRGALRFLLPLPMLSCAWAAAVAIGMLGLWNYETAPGFSPDSSPRWPTESGLALDPQRFTLILFAHPRCPCTAASIEELAHILPHVPEKLRSYVLFVEPGDAAREWRRTTLYQSVLAIPGVQVCPDVVGTEAKRFGAATSGHVMLYRPDGTRVFSGGITGSRGHRGDNAGHSAVLACVLGDRVAAPDLPVFGCALFDPCLSDCEDSLCRKENIR